MSTGFTNAVNGLVTLRTFERLSYYEKIFIDDLDKSCNATFTKSGGLTSMEIIAACKGSVWIHQCSAPKYLPKAFRYFKTIRGGMPPWENGNAKYLIAKKGASFVTPATFEKQCADFFSA